MTAMSPAKLGAQPRGVGPPPRRPRSGTGPPGRKSRALPLGLFRRHALRLLVCIGIGLAGGEAALSLLPPRYVATARILVDAPQRAAIGRSPEIARQLIAELHLDTDPTFNPALRDSAKQAAAGGPRTTPAPWRLALDWLHDQTGFTPPDWAMPATGEEALAAHFWSHVDIDTFGRSSRIVGISVWSDDARLSAAIANGVARLSQKGATLLGPANVPANPASPPEFVFLLSGGVAGLAFGALLGMGRNRSPRAFRQAEELEAASGLPVVAAIRQLQDGKTALAAVLRDPLSPFAESLRDAYDALRGPSSADPPKVAAIVSSSAGEGRSVLAAALGRLLASEGARILLIDCDWRHPDLHRLFRLPNETGLTSLLIDNSVALDDVISTDALSGLDIITAGRRNRRATLKLISDPMRKILESLSEFYDLILLDMPPVLLAEEAALLSHLADKMLFLVRWSNTGRRAALTGIEKILSTQGDIAGLVFTRVDADRYRKYHRQLPTTN